MNLTLEQEIEIENLEEKLKFEYDKFYTEKYFPIQVHRFRTIKRHQQEYWELTGTYYHPYDMEKESKWKKQKKHTNFL